VEEEEVGLFQPRRFTTNILPASFGGFISVHGGVHTHTHGHVHTHTHTRRDHATVIHLHVIYCKFNAKQHNNVKYCVIDSETSGRALVSNKHPNS